MSNADQGTREWRFYIQDMIEFSEKVLSYTEGMDQADIRRRFTQIRCHLTKSETHWRGGYPHPE